MGRVTRCRVPQYKVGWGMHVEPSPSDTEATEFFPPSEPGEPDPYGVMTYKGLLERIRVPADRSLINSVGWSGQIQLIDYKGVRVRIEFADLCVDDILSFNPFLAIPHVDDEVSQEAFLLDPFGKPIGYVGTLADSVRHGTQAESVCLSPIERIFALQNPKLLKYVLWCEESSRKRWANLYVVSSNECFEKLVRRYGLTDPVFCDRLRELIAKRNAI